ncbi:MAG: helix-turn-helix domain-containing protein [DPANN group archaeon]|nr:helix-turn-helix domain-containing protein [DPANN group archaeon]
MTRCEICGSAAKIRKVNLEGGTIEACFYCVPRTKVESRTKFVKRKQFENTINRPRKALIDNYASLIKSEREKNNLTQKEFAHKVEEHESIIVKIEQGTFRPNFAVARKIEQLFKITLVKQLEVKKEFVKSNYKKDNYKPKNKLDNIIHTENKKRPAHSIGCTIADYIKINKKQSKS